MMKGRTYFLEEPEERGWGGKVGRSGGGVGDGGGCVPHNR